VCVQRYTRHHYVATRMRAQAVADEFAEHASEERQHASRALTRPGNPGARAPERKGYYDMGTMEKQGQQQGGQGQPGHDRDKDRQGQQQQEPGRNPQPGGGQGDRSGQGGPGERR